MDAPLAPEQGIDNPENARELAIQLLKMKQDFKGLAGGGLFAVVIVVAIWALSGGGYFWPVWVMLGAAIAIVSTGWKAYGPANRITEDDVQREMSRGA